MKAFIAILTLCLAISACAKEVEKDDNAVRAEQLLQQGHAFIDAACSNDIVKARKLIESGFDVNYRYKDGEGETPLRWAVFEDRPELIELLVECGADIDAKNNAGETPVYRAVFKGHSESLKMLLEKGADPNMADNKGITPLHLAAGTGNSKLAELLLDNGAKVNAKDGKGRTPLDVLQDEYCYSFTTLLVRHGAVRKKRPKDIIEAARYGEVNAVQRFISTGADVNVEDEYHTTPLCYAVQLQDATLCGLLIEAGADVNVKTGHGTPLLIAARKGDTDIVKLLVERGADVNAPDSGWMPLHDAISEGYLRAAKYLLSKGAKPNSIDKTGRTALDYAVQGKKKDLEDVLRSYGAKTREELSFGKKESGQRREDE